jgi:hypothetical protein
MRGLIVIVLVLLACLAPTALAQAGPSAEAAFAQLTREDSPVAPYVDRSRAVAYTSSNDPDRLLGRPGQYVGKVVFVDTRIAPAGGSLEVFRNSADVAARVAHLRQAAQPGEYLYTSGSTLLRLSTALPPEAAEDYATALGARASNVSQ